MESKIKHVRPRLRPCGHNACSWGSAQGHETDCNILQISLAAQHSRCRISRYIVLGWADLLIMPVARAPVVALLLASARRPPDLFVMAPFSTTSVPATTVVTLLLISIMRELIMHPIADSVCWKPGILEVRALLAFIPPFAADLALHCQLAGITADLLALPLTVLSVSGALSQIPLITSLSSGFYRPPLQLDEVGNQLSIHRPLLACHH